MTKRAPTNQSYRVLIANHPCHVNTGRGNRPSGAAVKVNPGDQLLALSDIDPKAAK